MPTITPYGTWRSPITAERIASSQVGLGQIAVDGDDVYWVEGRPAEAGRSVVVRARRGGGPSDVTPPPFSARSRVHEYGGGSFAVDGGLVVFTNFADQQVYAQEAGGPPRRLSGEGDGRRYADFAFDRARGRVLCVCEDHGGGASEPRNSLASVRLDGSGVEIIAEGHDFYSSPRLSRDGRRIAWITWDHPDMPWDGTQLWTAPVAADGRLGEPRCVAGGRRESIVQPEWSPGGKLFFISDRGGWWNLYREGGEAALFAIDADCALAPWIFAQSTYAFEAEARVACSWAEAGVWRLGLLDAKRGRRPVVFDLPFTDVSFVRAAPGRVVFRGAGPAIPASVVELDTASGTRRVLRRSSETEIEDGFLSVGEAMRFATAGGATAHAFFYAPRNREFAAPAGEKPPLLVMTHGGPTASTSNSLNPRVQFWTSRGIAVLDVNYRGSTGYGRAYRDLLQGQWGVADVDDCVHGATALVREGRVDPDRLAITGSSAGGYTTLCALTFRDRFRAGASYYGIGDLEALAHDTHKFESHYEEGLVGPYPARRDLYRQRSPIHFVERLSCPVIFFQGLDDRVVPPNQSEQMVAALRAKGIAVEYLTFEGEGHGFRRAETIRRCLEAELAFYGRVFGFGSGLRDED